MEKVFQFFDSILQQDVLQICESYFPQADTYVFVEGPRYSTIGYPNIAQGWQDFCNSPLKIEEIQWLEGPFVEEYDQLAWIAGIVLIRVTLNQQVVQRKFRATFVLKKNEFGNWQIRHEHISAPLEDPYGIGDWLQKKSS
jgi:ketosteroid isomerase-like protein